MHVTSPAFKQSKKVKEFLVGLAQKSIFIISTITLCTPQKLDCIFFTVLDKDRDIIVILNNFLAHITASFSNKVLEKDSTIQ
jgi:hypothetical protein